MTRFLTSMGLVCLALVVGGCSQYVEDFYFVPRPALAELPATTPGQPPPIVALASIVGVRREDSKAKLPASIEVRLRVDNNGPQNIALDPHDIELTNGLFLKFGAPTLQPEAAATLPPNQSAVITAIFPFPAGRSYNNTDLSSLQLRWLLVIDARPTRQVVYFTRAFPPYYYDPYYDYGPWWGGRSRVFFHGDFGRRR